MTAHKGPASLRPRCTRSGSSVTAIPVCSWRNFCALGDGTSVADNSPFCDVLVQLTEFFIVADFDAEKCVTFCVTL
jgi:hypothetical protein